MDKFVFDGKWDENTSWEFYLSNKIPDESLCTAVFCLAMYNGKIVLTRTQRGWEIPGGHIELEETIEQALHREMMEEGGVSLKNYKPFGYQKIISKEPVARTQSEGFYPFPFSYIPFFVGECNLEAQLPTGPEVIERGIFDSNNLDSLGLRNTKIFEIGVQIAKDQKY